MTKIDYTKLEDTLNSSDTIKFTGDDTDRLNAAKELLNSGGLDALVIVGDYRLTKAHFGIHEPCPAVRSTMDSVWIKYSGQYSNLSHDNFLRKAAKHYLGHEPKDDEVISSDKYKQIYQAFHIFFVPSIVMGRVDNDIFAGNTPKNTLNRIIKGYEKLKAFSTKT